MPVDNTEQRIRSAEANIRKILGILMQIAVGGRVNSQNIVGVIPKDQGGTGSNAGSLAVFPKFINDSGGSLSNGAVVIFDPAGAREITTTTTAGHRLVAGAVSGSGSPYAAAAETPVMMVGYHTALFVTGAVSIGNYLKTSTVAGRAISAGAEPQAGIFAIALSSAAGPGDGTVAAFIFAGSMTRILEEITAKGDLLAAPGAGDLDPLAVGVDGTLLQAWSAATLGMRWVDPSTLVIGQAPDELIIPIGSETEQGQTYSPTGGAGLSYTQFGNTRRLINSGRYNWTPLKACIEVHLSSDTGGFTAHARLWNITLGAAVPNSDVETGISGSQRLRSQDISSGLAALDHEYRIEFGGEQDGDYTCYDAVLLVGDENLVVGEAGAGGDDELANEIMNWPALEQADNAQPEWWEESAGTMTLTDVDVAGEGITETYGRALKAVSSADVYGYQRYTYADQLRLKPGRTVSVAVAVWSVGGVTARVRLQSTVGSLGVQTTTAAAWTILEVEGVVLDGTNVELRLEVATGTAYFVPLGLRIGSTAPGSEMAPRGLRPRWLTDAVQVKSLAGLADEATWTDIDVTANSSPLAVWAFLAGRLTDATATDDFLLCIRRNGSSEAASGNLNMLARSAGATAGGPIQETFNAQIMLDDQQIFEYFLDRVAGSGTLLDGSIALRGWMEWA